MSTYIALTKSEIADYYSTRIPHLRMTNQREWRCPCPIHQGTNPSLSIEAETGRWKCHSQCDAGGDVFSFEERLLGGPFPAAKKRVFGIIGRPDVPIDEENLQATYDYTDENGRLVYQCLRFWLPGSKQFRQRRPDGRGGYHYKLGELRRYPYRLPKWKNALRVAIVEGEKDVHSLENEGIAATCNSEGAGKFRDELVPWFSGKEVGIFCDFDEKGHAHALDVARKLKPVAKRVQIVELPGLKLKGDVSDYILAGHKRDELLELWANAPDWTPEFDFREDLPRENDRYVYTIEKRIEQVGGLTEYWNFKKIGTMPFPFDKLNRAVGGGMRKGELYVVGAETGRGKSSIAAQFAMHLCQLGYGGLIFSMEMDDWSYGQRMASILSGVNLLEFANAQMDDRPVNEEMRQLCRATATIARWGLRIVTQPVLTPSYVIAEMRHLTKAVPVHWVILDHIQLMTPDERTGKSTYERATAVSRALKQVAMEINVPLIALSQFNRSRQREKRAEPDISDFRDSGAIVEDSAGAMALFEDHDDAEAAQIDGRYQNGPVASWLKILKGRFGLQNVKIPLWHEKGATRFTLREVAAPAPMPKVRAAAAGKSNGYHSPYPD